MSGLYLITAPVDDVITLAEVKAQLRITSSDQDAVIQALIDSAVNQIDPAGGGWLGRALRPQTWELRMRGFPYWYDGCGYYRNHRCVYEQELRYPPLLSVDSVKYDDRDGVEQTLVENTGFRVFGLGSNGKARIAPVYNGSWPTSVRGDEESVRIRYTAGYELGSAPDEMPGPIKQAVVLMVKSLLDLFERNLLQSSITIEGVSTRSFVVTENAANLLKSVSENLLAPYRVWE
jgi:uncharacterized phiE125 gp8 family phage protein